MRKAKEKLYTARYYLILLLLLSGVIILIWRMIDLNVIKRDFLRSQGDARTIRSVNIPAYRGIIMDRNGVPLAISTPVESLWVNPQSFNPTTKQLTQLGQLLRLSANDIKERVLNNTGREFVYLKRSLNPSLAQKIKELDLPGLFFQHEYRRYYPQAEVTAHVVGFTNIDDKGQEGLELAYNDWLQGKPGEKQVLKDRYGRIVGAIGELSEPRPGHDLVLSLDHRIQYLAYRDLKLAAEKYKAKSASLVVIDTETQEILAMVNYPSYNPNRRYKAHTEHYRNRVVTDVFEPGSALKVFSVISVLRSGLYTPYTKVNTSPGWIMVEGHKIHDTAYVNHGTLSVTGVLQKSSNVGITKLTLSLPPEDLVSVLRDVGFGEISGIGFPGESGGKLELPYQLKPFSLATLSFGYGISVTTLQLAQSYAILAAGGLKRPLTLLKRQELPKGKQVISKKISKEVLNMLEAVAAPGGTATRANIPGYRVAGKTGTVRIVGPQGYESDHHIAIFVGTAPASHPRLVAAVVMNDPQGGVYYGGLVAAPVFAKVIGGALRILDVPPDKIEGIA